MKFVIGALQLLLPSFSSFSQLHLWTDGGPKHFKISSCLFFFYFLFFKKNWNPLLLLSFLSWQLNLWCSGRKYQEEDSKTQTQSKASSKLLNFFKLSLFINYLLFLSFFCDKILLISCPFFFNLLAFFSFKDFESNQMKVILFFSQNPTFFFVLCSFVFKIVILAEKPGSLEVDLINPSCKFLGRWNQFLGRWNQFSAYFVCRMQFWL